MLTAHDLDDPASPRIARYLPRFREAALPQLLKLFGSVTPLGP